MSFCAVQHVPPHLSTHHQHTTLNKRWKKFCHDLCEKLGGHVKFILPYAPNSPVTCNGGMKMPSWMDLIEIPISPESPDNGLQQV